MIIHLTPRFFNSYSDITVDLLYVEIPEFDLKLIGNKDITIKKPYPNKKYSVVCRKKGKKAINGILIETDKFIRDFTVITGWNVNGEESIHKVHYHLSETDFDVVSDYMMFWNGFYNTAYDTRQNKEQKEWIPAYSQPRMNVLEIDSKVKESQRDSVIYNELRDNGIIKQRVEYYNIPTIEKERLLTPFWGNEHERIPSLEDAFHAKTSEYQYTLKPNYSEFGIDAIELSEWIEELESELYSPDSFESFSIKLLKEINNKEKYFFSNTTDLVNKVNYLCPSYHLLDNADKKFIDGMLNQPIFTVTYPDEEKYNDILKKVKK